MFRGLFLISNFFLLFKYVEAQNAISVHSQGSLIQQIAEADNKLYVATYGRGVAVYDMVSNSYQIMDISNSPMNTNNIWAEILR